MPGFSVFFHAESCPIFQFLIDITPSCLRHQPERITSEIDRLGAIFCYGKMKPLAKTTESIASVHLRRRHYCWALVIHHLRQATARSRQHRTSRGSDRPSSIGGHGFALAPPGRGQKDLYEKSAALRQRPHHEYSRLTETRPTQRENPQRIPTGF